MSRMRQLLTTNRKSTVWCHFVLVLGHVRRIFGGSEKSFPLCDQEPAIPEDRRNNCLNLV